MLQHFLYSECFAHSQLVISYLKYKSFSADRPYDIGRGVIGRINVPSQNTKSEMNRSYLIDQYCVDLNGHAVVNIYPALLWQQLYLIWLCNNGCRLTNTLPPHNKMAFDRPTIPEMALPEHNRWRYTSTCCLKRSPTNCSYLVFDLTIYCRVFVGESFQTTAIRQTGKDLFKRTAQSVNTWPVSVRHGFERGLYSILFWSPFNLCCISCSLILPLISPHRSIAYYRDKNIKILAIYVKCMKKNK